MNVEGDAFQVIKIKIKIYLTDHRAVRIPR